MKNNIFKAVFAVLAAAAVLVGCTAKQTPSAPKATLTADASFVNGSANLTVALSEASSSEVTVTLAVSGTLPEANLTWNPVVKIAAGSKQASVPVTAKADGLEAGTYAAKFSIKAASGAEVGSPAEASVNLTVEAKPEEVVPEVSISKYDDAFTDGKATITLALSAAASADVKVNFALGTEVEEGSVIAADALTFENPATIKAGETSKVVEISLDLAKIAAGTNWAIISIENAEGATVGKKNIAYIEAEGSLQVILMEDWKVEYYGHYDYTFQDGSVRTFDAILFSGMGRTPFVYDIYSAGTLEYNKMTPVDYVKYKYDRCNTLIGQGYTADDLGVIVPEEEDGYGDLITLLDPGDYELVMMGCTEGGVITGGYTYYTFTVEDPNEASDAYLAWIGKWTIGADTYYIDPKWNNESFNIYGFDPDFDFPATLIYDAENDLIKFCYSEEQYNSSMYLLFMGLQMEGENGYLVWGDEDNDDMFALMKKDGDAVVIDGIAYTQTYNDGTTSDLQANRIGYLLYDTSDSKVYLLTSWDYKYIDLPASPVLSSTAPAAKKIINKSNLESSRIERKPIYSKVTPERVRFVSK